MSSSRLDLDAGRVCFSQRLDIGNALRQRGLLLVGRHGGSHVAYHPIDDVTVFHVALHVLALDLVVQSAFSLQNIDKFSVSLTTQ